MTAQISDNFLFNGDEYELIGIKGGELVKPEEFKMEPEMISTACQRGYYAKYELANEGLFLRELTLHEKNGNYLPIKGIEPDKEEYQATYNNLNLPISFSGKIRLAKDLITDFSIHMGFQKATAFKTVLDLTLEVGKVIHISDRSEEMRDKSGAFKKRYETGNLKQGIDEAFSLDMDLE
ncbi:hypothetical protein ACFL35_05090 [Candidatus Riflebacteria bacterium]